MTANTTTPTHTDLLTLTEAQELLRVSHWTLHRLIAERELPTIRIGRRRFIARTDAAAFIDRSRRGGAR